MSAAIIDVTTRLLNAVGAGDYATYKRLSDARLTAIEPESCGTVVEGLAFHKHFFDLGKGAPASPKLNTVSAPHVHMLGPDAAVIAYIRVIQDGGKVVTCEETRVWRKSGGEWKNVHFHRSSRL